MNFEYDIEECVKVLDSEGLILYPTDTVWGIGCDATSQRAVQKVFALKQREDSRKMIVLISPQMEVSRYVGKPDPEILSYLSQTSQPVTAIYENGKNVAPGLINGDRTLAIRIVKDEFCAALINKFNKPVISTSANISGEPAPANFVGIDIVIKKGVDYIVQHRRGDFSVAKPSAIIKLNEEKKIMMLRS